MTQADPDVSVIVPVRDEEERVDALVAGVAAQDYAGDVELLVADGGSRDRSVERLQAAARRAGLRLTVLHNEDGRIPHGLNACVRAARAEFVVRMDCRGRYPHDYVRRCVNAARATGAWNVGGVIAPEGESRTERAVACAMDSPFGGIGWSRRAGAPGPVEVDTVYCGTFRRELFSVVGHFDEALPFNEDEDLNFRIRRAGGRVVLDPGLRIRYTARGSLRAVARQYYRYGRGKADVTRKHRAIVSARSLAPLALVASLAPLAAGSARSRSARRLFAVEALLYAGVAAAFAWRVTRARGEPYSLAPLIAAAFAAMHFGYGVGAAHGLLRALQRPPAAEARPHG
jgi:glycosyltransferase involved in cell wall biosynthesis